MLEFFERTADGSADRPLRPKTKTTTKVPVPFVVVLTVEASALLLGQLVGEDLDLGA